MKGYHRNTHPNGGSKKAKASHDQMRARFQECYAWYRRGLITEKEMFRLAKQWG